MRQHGVAVASFGRNHASSFGNAPTGHAHRRLRHLRGHLPLIACLPLTAGSKKHHGKSGQEFGVVLLWEHALFHLSLSNKIRNYLAVLLWVLNQVLKQLQKTVKFFVAQLIQHRGDLGNCPLHITGNFWGNVLQATLDGIVGLVHRHLRCGGFCSSLGQRHDALIFSGHEGSSFGL